MFYAVLPSPGVRSAARCGRITAVVLPLFLAGMASAASHDTRITTYVDSSTCTECHANAASDIMHTTHWTWERTNSSGPGMLGKKHVINNYCIALGSNEPRCTSCHIGVGYRDKTFNFNDATKVDCLVCHDTTGTYKKFPTLAGAPWTGPGPTNFSGVVYQAVDLTHVAKNVGRTSRATCGACHFFGGGGDAVKHGDLDSSLFSPARDLDVHMGTNGMNFACTRCHTTTRHEIAGSYYSKTTTDNLLCQRCHTREPHLPGTPGDRLNAHTARVACQTCHIPEFARGRTTKMTWDWSTAGQKGPDGKNIVIKDANGDPVYDTQKGHFTWARDVVPDYVWFNGGMTYVTADDELDGTSRVTINKLHGNINDTNSLIFPVKRFTGKQPYDAGNKRLAVPHLFGSDTNAYWRTFDWGQALLAGQTYVGRPFSGQVGFVETEMFWIENHMVAPKEKALTCGQCHTPRSRIDFAALGYPTERAVSLQTMLGFEVEHVALVTGSKVQLRWNGAPGSRYTIKSSTDLRSWSDVANGTINAGTNVAPLTWEEMRATGTRFYRILRSSQ